MSNCSWAWLCALRTNRLEEMANKLACSCIQMTFAFFFFFFSKVRVGEKEGGSHYWEMAVAITCGYGGYLLPLLATHSSYYYYHYYYYHHHHHYYHHNHYILSMFFADIAKMNDFFSLVGARKCKGAIYFCRPSSQYVSAIQNEGVPFVIPAQRHLFCCWTCTTQVDMLSQGQH